VDRGEDWAQQTSLQRAVSRPVTGTDINWITRAALETAQRLSGGSRWIEENRRRSRGYNAQPSPVPTEDVTREWLGATYIPTEPPEYRHAGDAAAQLIIAGAPRTLPVSQEIERGAKKSRNWEFDAAMEEAEELVT